MILPCSTSRLGSLLGVDPVAIIKVSAVKFLALTVIVFLSTNVP